MVVQKPLQRGFVAFAHLVQHPANGALLFVGKLKASVATSAIRCVQRASSIEKYGATNEARLGCSRLTKAFFASVCLTL